MAAGAMRERITIQEPLKQEDEFGDHLPTYGDMITVWARKIEKTGKQLVQADQVAAEQFIIFRIRFLDGMTITAKHRVRWRERLLDISEPPIVDTHRRYIELRCTEHG